MRQLKTGIKT